MKENQEIKEYVYQNCNYSKIEVKQILKAAESQLGE